VASSASSRAGSTPFDVAESLTPPLPLRWERRDRARTSTGTRSLLGIECCSFAAIAAWTNETAMDHDRFDGLTRSLGVAASRRSLGRALAGGGLGTFLGSAFGTLGADARRKGARRGTRRRRSSAARRTVSTAPAATMAATARLGHAAARRSAVAATAVCRSRSSTPVPGAAARESTTVGSPSAPTTWTAPLVLGAAAVTLASKARSTALATSFDRRCHARTRPTVHWALTARTPHRGGFAFQSARRKKGASLR
jgi:hypothetical protein